MIKENSLQWLWQRVQGSQWRITLCALAGILRVVFGLGFVYESKNMIDIATNTAIGSLTDSTILMGLLMTGCIGLNSAAGRISAIAEIKIQNSLQLHFFAALLQSKWQDAEKFHSGDIQSRLGMDVCNVSVLLTKSLPLLLVSCAQLFASVWFLAMLDKILALILSSGILIFLLSSRVLGKRMRRLTHRVRERESAVQSLTQEGIQHHMVVKVLGQKKIIYERLADLQSALFEAVSCRSRFSILSRSVVSFGFTAGYIVTFVWGAKQLQVGSISFGVMAAYLQLISQVQRPVIELTQLVPSIIGALASVDRLQELEVLNPEINEPSIVLNKVCGLKLQQISFGYDSSNFLNNINYDFKPGSITAVLGPTGVGKTTLFRLVLALILPNSGKISLYNTDEKIEVSALTRRNFIYVPQGNTLFSGTIKENLKLGNIAATDKDMYIALHAAAAEFVYMLPKGLDTYCGEQGYGLSEGQAQRVAIARSLLQSGSILLLDEITSALDTDTELLLLERLRGYARNKTIIFITHREAMVENYDKLIL